MVGQLAAQIQALLVLAQVFQGMGGVGDLLAARLDGEVGLAQRDDLLIGIGVLNQQVTGVALDLEILYLPPSAGAEPHNFPGAVKMVGCILTAVLTGQDGALDRLAEALPLGIAQNLHQGAGRPVGRTIVRSLAYLLERRDSGRDFVAHHSSVVTIERFAVCPSFRASTRDSMPPYADDGQAPCKAHVCDWCREYTADAETRQSAAFGYQGAVD
jgi:hypothetical protein